MLNRVHKPWLILILITWLAPARAAVLPAPGYSRGSVAADHPLASAAGVEILKQGGNAVDAACATAFALGVVNPAGSGIGGGGFMLLLRPGNTAPEVLDFRETAPAAASRDMFVKAPGKLASRLGGLAVGIPGEVLGCAEAVKQYGKLGLARVLAPAIRLARRGFPVGPHLARSVTELRKRISKHSPAVADLFLPGGKPLQQGQTMRRPRLARSLQAIARKGPTVFYRGWIAQDLVQAVTRAGGLLTLEDLKAYRTRTRKPLRASYRGYTIHAMPPPSSGGVALIQALNILGHRRLKRRGHNSSAYLHLLAEALKHAFADRARYLGDPDFVKVPVGRLTSAAYAAALNRRIGKGVAAIQSYGTPTDKPETPTGNSAGTSHISVVDAGGMAVAMTTTINTGFGSMVVGPRSGIILNNQMDDFAARPGKPNAFGLVQGEQNAVAPGKRPLSSMSPTIVTRDGKLVLVVGASGGPTIITGTLQVMLNVLDFGLEARAAVSRSRIHHQWMPNKLYVEPDLPRDVKRALERRGHRVRLFKRPFTAVQLVLVGPDGKRYGAADPRKQGQAAGY